MFRQPWFRCGLQALFALGLSCAAPSMARAERPKTRVRMLHAENPDDVALTPGNLTAGVATAFDEHAASVLWGSAVGAELVSGVWRRFAWTVVELRVVLYRPCPRCGLVGDGFVGPRLGAVLASDAKRRHLLTLGTGVGWGTIGQGWGGRDPTRHGAALAPALRYTFAGFLGVELGALLPAYDPGGPYPAVATLNLVGFPALLVGMAKPMRFW